MLEYTSLVYHLYCKNHIDPFNTFCIINENRRLTFQSGNNLSPLSLSDLLHMQDIKLSLKTSCI